MQYTYQPISQEVDNQAMKSGELIEYDAINIFLEKSYKKCGGETIPKTFSEKSNLSISLDH